MTPGHTWTPHPPPPASVHSPTYLCDSRQTSLIRCTFHPDVRSRRASNPSLSPIPCDSICEKPRFSATKRGQRYATEARSVLQNRNRFSLHGGAAGEAAKRSQGAAVTRWYLHVSAATATAGEGAPVYSAVHCWNFQVEHEGGSGLLLICCLTSRQSSL